MRSFEGCQGAVGEDEVALEEVLLFCTPCSNHPGPSQGVKEELDSLRAAKEAEWEAGAEARAAAAAEAAAREAAEAEAREQIKAAKKEMIVAYHAEVDKRMEEEERRRREQAEAEAEERAGRAGHNAERVEWRQAEFKWKRDKAAEELRAREEEERQRQERLDRLRAMVAPQARDVAGRHIIWYSVDHGWGREGSLGILAKDYIADHEHWVLIEIHTYQFEAEYHGCSSHGGVMFTLLFTLPRSRPILFGFSSPQRLHPARTMTAASYRRERPSGQCTVTLYSSCTRTPSSRSWMLFK